MYVRRGYITCDRVPQALLEMPSVCCKRSASRSKRARGSTRGKRKSSSKSSSRRRGFRSGTAGKRRRPIGLARNARTVRRIAKRGKKQSNVDKAK